MIADQVLFVLPALLQVGRQPGLLVDAKLRRSTSGACGELRAVTRLHTGIGGLGRVEQDCERQRRLEAELLRNVAYRTPPPVELEKVLHFDHRRILPGRAQRGLEARVVAQSDVASDQPIEKGLQGR